VVERPACSKSVHSDISHKLGICNNFLVDFEKMSFVNNKINLIIICKRTKSLNIDRNGGENTLGFCMVQPHKSLQIVENMMKCFNESVTYIRLLRTEPDISDVQINRINGKLLCSEF